ncbi:MAG: ABC transporter substrate-binding protein [Bacillota bacterium]
MAGDANIGKDSAKDPTVAMAELFATFYHFITKEIVDSLGEEKGKELVRRAVHKFGLHSPGQNIDFQSPLTAMAAAKPDLYYFGAEYNDAAMIVKQAREMGIKETISCSGLEYANEFINLGGAAIEGVYLNTLFFPNSPDPKDKAFVDAFNKKFSKLPTINASESYEAAKVLFEAIRIGGTDRAKVRDALENMNGFVAFNRPVTFSKTNHNSFNSHYIILQVKDGKFTPVQ